MKEQTTSNHYFEEYKTITEHLSEDLYRGIEEYCESFRGKLFYHGDSFVDSYSLFYNPKTRTFLVNPETDSLSNGLNLIKIFPEDPKDFHSQFDTLKLSGPCLLDVNLFVIETNFSEYFHSSPEIIVHDNESLVNIISNALLFYNNKVSDYFSKRIDYKDFPVFSKLGIYTPLLDKENKEKCFISSIAFLTDIQDCLLEDEEIFKIKGDLFQKRSITFKELIDKRDIKDIFFELLCPYFNREELQDYLNKTIINKKEFSILYKNINFKTSFLIEKEDRDLILKKLVDDLKNNKIRKKIYNKKNIYHNASYLKKITVGTKLDSGKILNEINFYDFIFHLINGLNFFKGEGSKEVLFETDLDNNSLKLIRSFYKDIDFFLLQ